MARTTFKKRDMNRFRRVYPYLRKAPRDQYCSDKSVVIEIGTVTFSSSSGPVIHTFQETFPETPVVTAIAVDYQASGGADVNIFISSVSSTSVSFESSHQFDGTVDFHAIWIGS